MDEREVHPVTKYIEDRFMRDDSRDRFEDLETFSYSRWAAEEVLVRVVEETEILPEHISGIEARTLDEVIDEFIDDMSMFHEMSERLELRRIFWIAMCEGSRMRSHMANEMKGE